jgi:hypothetical protein
LTPRASNISYGPLEPGSVVFRRRLSFVDVVTGHEDEVVIEAFAEGRHLLRDRDLLWRSTTAVADHRELYRALFVWKAERTERQLVENDFLDDGAVAACRCRAAAPDQKKV